LKNKLKENYILGVINNKKEGKPIDYGSSTEGQTKEMIDKIARFIVDKGMETPAILFLESIKPLSYMGSQLTLFTIGPFLTLLGEYEERGYEFIKLFEKGENIEYLIQCIEALIKEEKDAEKSAPEKKIRIRDSAIIQKLLKLFRKK